MKYLLVMILSFLSSMAWAASDNGVFDRGNGGDVVICTQANGGKTYQLLDLYEQAKGALTPLKYSSDLGFREILTQQINHIGHRLPKVRAALKFELTRLSKSVYFTDASKVPEIQDEDSYSINSNCVLRQLAAQWGTNSPHGRIYLINTHYFLSLDSKNKATLILHELVYRLFSLHYPNEELTSRMVRRYVGFFLSEEFDRYAPVLFPDGFLVSDVSMRTSPHIQTFLSPVSE